MGKVVKFTKEEIISAIKRYNNGECIKDIAESLGRSRTRLSEKMK